MWNPLQHKDVSKKLSKGPLVPGDAVLETISSQEQQLNNFKPRGKKAQFQLATRANDKL